MATKTGADAVVWRMLYVQATDLRRMSPWKRKAAWLALSEKNDCGLLVSRSFCRKVQYLEIDMSMYVCMYCAVEFTP